MVETFRWWRVCGGADGQNWYAVPFDDSPELCRAIDAAEGRGWYGTIEGCILHGGVEAIAIRRERHQTYDAKHWIDTGERKLAGVVIVTTITAVPKSEVIVEQGESYEL